MTAAASTDAIPAALLSIDVQRGWDDPRWGRRNNPHAEQRMGDLLALWRGRGWPVFHIRYASRTPDSPLRPGQEGYEFKPEARPKAGEPVLTRSVNSAFIGTDLEERLRVGRTGRVVVAGLTTPHCVSTTARMAANLGFDTIVVADACAAFELPDGRGGSLEPDLVHEVALAELRGEFASIATTASFASLVRVA